MPPPGAGNSNSHPAPKPVSSPVASAPSSPSSPSPSGPQANEPAFDPRITDHGSRITHYASRITSPASPVRLSRDCGHGAPHHHYGIYRQQPPDHQQPWPRVEAAGTSANPPPPGRYPNHQYPARRNHQHQPRLAPPNELTHHQRLLPAPRSINHPLSTINLGKCPASS